MEKYMAGPARRFPSRSLQSRTEERETDASISVLRSILNGLDAYVYVSDPETDEILFINDKMRDHFGIVSAGVGETCWKVLQEGQAARCSFCPNYKLAVKPDETIVWEEHNTVTKRYYRNSDRLIPWIGGKLVHMQHSVDITESKLAAVSLQRRLDQQELMSGITQNFIANEDMVTTINRSLQLVGEFMNVDRIRLGHHEGGASLPIQFQWRDKALQSENEACFPLDFSDGVPLYEQIVTKKFPYVVMNNVSANPEYQDMAKHGIKSFLMFPIYVANRVWGILSIVKTQQVYDWTGSDIHLGVLISNVLGGVIGRHQTEEQLLRVSSIVSSSPQFIFYMNREFQQEYVNDGALEMTGYTREELMKGGLRLLFAGDMLVNLEEVYLPAVLELGKMDLTLPVRCRGGDTKMLAFSIFTMDDGRRIAGVATDMTEKVRLERETTEAREQAEKSSRAKGEFLSRMSHEMRTPMNAIIGMTNIAKASNSPERKEYCLDKIADASRHLLGVINDILDISKIEADKLELSYSEFNFEKMLMRVTNVINFKVEEKNQILTINVDMDVPRNIISDEQRLSQIITNLLSNATKFTPEGGLLALSVQKTAERAGICTLHISVRDSGIGIAKDQQERLFHLFEQADGGISRRFGGTGLGLAICKKLVELMGGAIWIESELGEGATFQFTVQVKRGLEDAPVCLSPGVRWEDLRLLAVDDSPETREYIEHAMRAMKLHCDIAASGEDALAMIRNADEPYDMIFVDWMMPLMNGIELTKEIRSMAGVNPVIIMISASAWSDVEKDARSVGITRFIQKPLFLSQFVDTINECLGQGAMPRTDEEYVKSAVPRFPGRTVLLAEDNEINREIAQALLEDTGITLHCAEDGAQAVAMYQENSGLYDMIFMDIHMPEVDGLEATRRIRALDVPGAATIPIVAMTANVFREDVEKCLAAGMNEHIGKPLDTDELYAILRNFLPGRDPLS